jgi:hypothetical protein
VAEAVQSFVFNRAGKSCKQVTLSTSKGFTLAKNMCHRDIPRKNQFLISLVLWQNFVCSCKQKKKGSAHRLFFSKERLRAGFFQ